MPRVCVDPFGQIRLLTPDSYMYCPASIAGHRRRWSVNFPSLLITPWALFHLSYGLSPASIQTCISHYFFKEPAAATTGPESSIAPFVPRDLTAGVSVGPSDSKFLAHARCLFQGLNAVVPKVQHYSLEAVACLPGGG